jgi:hypothetical protein
MEVGADLVGEFVIDDVVGGHGLALGLCWRRMFWLVMMRGINAY